MPGWSRSVAPSRSATSLSGLQQQMVRGLLIAPYGDVTARLERLRARGIPFDTARAMLVEAFATEILDTVTLPSLRDHLESAVATTFNSRSAP